MIVRITHVPVAGGGAVGVKIKFAYLLGGKINKTSVSKKPGAQYWFDGFWSGPISQYESHGGNDL